MYVVLALGAEEGFQLVSVKEGTELKLAVSCHSGLPIPTVVKVPDGVLVDDKAPDVKVVDGIIKRLVLYPDSQFGDGKVNLVQLVGNFVAKIVAVCPAKKRKYSRKGYVAYSEGQSYKLPSLRKQKKV